MKYTWIACAFLMTYLPPAEASGTAVDLPLTGPAYLVADDAYQAYARGDYTLAVEKAREAIRLRPDVSRLRVLLQKALDAQAAASPTQHARRTPRQSQPARDPAFLSADTAYKAYDRHQYQQAIDAATEAVRKAPNNLNYRLLLINAQMAAQQFVKAEQSLAESIALLGADPQLLKLRVAVRSALALKPAQQAYSDLKQGANSAAVESAKQAVAYAPGNESYQLLLTTALLRAGQWDEAAQIASATFAAHSDIAPLVLRAYARQRQGQGSAAQADFDQALQMAKSLPDDVQRDIRLIAADAALAANQPKRALDILSAAPADDKDVAQRREAAQRRIKLVTPGKESLAAANDFSPPIIDCSWLVERKACAVMPAALPGDPAYPLARQAYQLFDAGQYEAAVVKIQAALRLAPDNRDYRWLLINALMAMRRLEESELAASAAIEQDSQDAALYVQRGRIRQALGKTQLADADFKAALRFGGLPLQQEVGILADTNQLDAARAKFADGVKNGAFVNTANLDFAYLANRVGEKDQASNAFASADKAGKLPDSALADAAFAAIKARRDAEAIAYFKRVIDAAEASRLHMAPQALFDTRRAVATLSREGGVIASLSQRGTGLSNGQSATPGPSSQGGLQAGVEAYWRPFGYQNGRTVEVFGRMFETLRDKNNGATGSRTLQGAVGARWKVFTEQNLVLSAARLIPLGSQATGDWLAQAAYSADTGGDLRVDVRDWWTTLWYAEADRYFQHPQTYGLASVQFGRSFRLDGVSEKLVLFPYLTLNGEYNTLNARRVAVGAGPGVNLRYWFRGDHYTAPRSFVELSLQYRRKIQGDERARGVFTTATLLY